MEAAATTIHLLETEAVTGRGTHAELFLPVPYEVVDDGQPPPPKEEPNQWVALWAALEAAVEAARHDPSDAQMLYNLAVLGCRTPESEQQLRATLTQLGIPNDSSVMQSPIAAVCVT